MWLRGLKKNIKTPFGKFNWTSLQVNTATWCILTRDCMWASFQVSRSFGTCIRDCQNYSFSTTQVILNTLTGSLLENEQHGEPGILRAKKDFQATGEWEHHLFLEEPIGSMLTAKVHSFSDSVFSTSPGALDPANASQIWEHKAEAAMNNDNCKSRMTLPERRMTSNGTYVLETHRCRYCKTLQQFISEIGHQSFPDRVIFTNVLNDITDNGCGSVQGKCVGQRPAPSGWCFCGPQSERTRTYNESRPILILVTGNGTNSLP